MIKAAVKPASVPMARYLWVASLAILSMFSDRATNTRPVRAAAPPPTITKKSCHCSGLYISTAIILYVYYHSVENTRTTIRRSGSLPERRSGPAHHHLKSCEEGRLLDRPAQRLLLLVWLSPCSKGSISISLSMYAKAWTFHSIPGGTVVSDHQIVPICKSDLIARRWSMAS
jgi:hypothetical protein